MNDMHDQVSNDLYEHVFAYRRVGHIYILLCLDNMFYGRLFSDLIFIFSILKINCV